MRNLRRKKANDVAVSDPRARKTDVETKTETENYETWSSVGPSTLSYLMTVDDSSFQTLTFDPGLHEAICCQIELRILETSEERQIREWFPDLGTVYT